MTQVNRVRADIFRKAFYEQWKQDIESNKDEIYRKFSTDSEWTQFIQPKGGFLNRVMDRLPIKLEYRTEYYTIDSLYVAGKDLLEKENLCYPSEIHALIEHENKDKIEEEMWKLAYLRSPLKVIIFYDYNDKEKESSGMKRGWLNNKLSSLMKMLKLINDFYKENEDTEYLFIIGARREPGGEIYWRWATNDQIQPTVFID